MKAVFVIRGCLLRQSEEGLAAALQSLAQTGLYTILLGVGATDLGQACGPESSALNERLVQQARTLGGRMDAMMHCPHAAAENCYCWDAQPGYLWQAARDLDIRLDESYVLCDSPTDVSLAYMAGCRPILVLDGRSVESLYEHHQPEPSDFPTARDIKQAIGYIIAEEETTVQLGHPRPATANAGLEEGEVVSSFPADVPARSLPMLTTFGGSILKRSLRPEQIIRYGGRWLALIVLGAVWLGLGIAYWLTHLYRVQAFPEFVWYLTLQFIPRPVRGGLFIATGVLVLIVAWRSVRGMLPVGVRWGREQKR